MSDPQINNAPIKSLAINDILIHAFTIIWRERRDFIAIAALPVFGLSLIAVLTHFYFIGDIAKYNNEELLKGIGTDVSVNSLMIMGIHYLMAFIFYIMFAVAWHRRCLLPGVSVSVGMALKWDVGKTAFLLRTLGLLAIMVMVCIPLSILLTLFAAVGFGLGSGSVFVMSFLTTMGVMFFIFSRLSLVLPAAAIKEGMAYKQAWQITRGNSWRMLLVYMVPSILVGIVQIVVLFFLASLLNSFGGLETLTGIFIFNLIQNFITYIGIAIGVAALSGAYKFFRDNIA